MRLFRTFVLRALRRDPARTALGILSIALGVAVVVAIDLAGEAATGSFRSSLETLVGSTDLQITANGTMDERWIGRLAALPVNARFAPVLEAQALIPDIGSFPLFGVDLVVQSGRMKPHSSVDPERAILVSDTLARRLRLQPGNEFAAVLNDLEHRFQVAGTIEGRGGAEFLVLDIAVAQKALGRYGSLDRIDVFVSLTEEFAGVERLIRSVLPAAYILEKPGTRSEENQKMLRAFRWNLRVLSYISLVVGAFLIYNTVAVSVVRRRPEIGVLRALGASRTHVLWLFLSEALVFGMAGSVAGVFLGRALAEGTVGMIAQTVNMLYVSSRPEPVSLGLGEALIGTAAGLIVAFLSALKPAREAMAVVPTEAMSRGALEHQARLDWRRGLGRAVVVGAGAVLAAGFGPWDGKPVGGYISALLAICSMALAMPAAVLGASALLRAPVRKLGVEGILAARNLVAALPRTSVMLGALATAVAMMTSVAIMVGSFRETVRLWLDTQLRADLYIRPAGRSGAGHFPALSPEVPRLAAAAPGVAAVDVFHGLELHYRGERATLGAGDLDIVRRYGRLRFLRGEDRDAILRSLPGRDRAIISEPFANKHGLRAGDALDLRLGARTVSLSVAGIYYDYSSSQGIVILDRSTLLKYLPQQPPTNLAVYVNPGVDARHVGEMIQKLASRHQVVVAPNSALRRQALVVFDRTFAVTYALEAVAILVAMLGAANSLLAMVLDRKRELGLLRYLGASSAQIRRTLLFEAGYLGALAAALGFALGLALSLLLIYVVNKQSFGWTIQFDPPAMLLAGALLGIWCATVAAGLYPARVAQRLNPVEVVHEE